MLRIIQAEDYKGTFASDAAWEKFVERLKKTLEEQGPSYLVANGRIIAIAVPASAIEKGIEDSVRKALMESNPKKKS